MSIEGIHYSIQVWHVKCKIQLRYFTRFNQLTLHPKVKLLFAKTTYQVVSFLEVRVSLSISPLTSISVFLFVELNWKVHETKRETFVLFSPSQRTGIVSFCENSMNESNERNFGAREVRYHIFYRLKSQWYRRIQWRSRHLSCSLRDYPPLTLTSCANFHRKISYHSRDFANIFAIPEIIYKILVERW